MIDRRVGLSLREAPLWGSRGRGYGNEFCSVVMKSWVAELSVGASDLVENRLLYYSSIIQKLNCVFILSVFPHQREEPDPTFANPEIGGGEGHI
jgi:hypothetical protein